MTAAAGNGAREPDLGQRPAGGAMSDTVGHANLTTRPIPAAPHRFVIRTRGDGRPNVVELWKQIEEALKDIDVVIIAFAGGTTDEGNCPCCNQPPWEWR